MLKVIYTFFTGVLLAVFVGVGISAFYPSPTYPDCRPIAVAPTAGSETSTATVDADCERQQDEYDQARQQHARFASLVSLVAALVFLAIGLLFAQSLGVLADGFVLGGVFTLLYSVAAGFDGEDFKFRFLIVSVGVVVALLLGYLKFVKPERSRG